MNHPQRPIKRLAYGLLSLITCGLLLLVQMAGADRSLAQAGYPPYFGEASRETLDNIRRVIEASTQAQAAIGVGSGVISTTTAMDAAEAGAAVAICITSPSDCFDPALQAQAIDGINDIIKGRVGHHIDSRLLDGDPIVGGSPLNPDEQAFWENMRAALENPSDFMAGLPSSSAASYGDPHIISFDGLRYSFQTVGEFVLMQSADRLFDVQARQSRMPGRDLSLNTAVALNVAGDRVGFYVQNFPDADTSTPLRINGRPVTLRDNTLTLPRGGTITRLGTIHYTVTGPGKEEAVIRLATGRDFPFINVVVNAAQTMPSLPLYTGIFGNFNTRGEDDMQTRSGRVIEPRSTYGNVSNLLSSVLPRSIPLRDAETLYFEQLSREFADSWRVSPAESLFDYAPGQTTASFTDRGFPNSFLTLRSLTPTQVRDAERTCQAEAVDPMFLEGCIFDVGLTQDNSFASAAGNLVLNQVTDRLLDEVQDRIPVPIPRRRRPGIRLPF
ncbi:MAG: VWD domain-containing protein [Kaiparowitsia implicata GSE-PSE-MK54-09C]|jgi:hypothetical protein|nr:VWD domain-containing protein [Kaiparowitsia implicata GSE-PSE-MK54-09C]